MARHFLGHDGRLEFLGGTAEDADPFAAGIGVVQGNFEEELGDLELAGDGVGVCQVVKRTGRGDGGVSGFTHDPWLLFVVMMEGGSCESHCEREMMVMLFHVTNGGRRFLSQSVELNLERPSLYHRGAR